MNADGNQTTSQSLQSGTIVAVGGPLPPQEAGVTLVHEHVFIDLRTAYPGSAAKRVEAPLSMEMLGEARRDPHKFPDAMVADDVDLVVDDVIQFRQLGGQTVVDATPIGLRPASPQLHPLGLIDVSRKAGVNIVAGCGYYVHESHPAHLAEMSAEALAEGMIDEISRGIQKTDIRPGVIGEIGMSQPVHPDEWKVLRAACLAQRATGLALIIHPYYGARSRIAPDVLKFVLRQGVDPLKVCICHMDGYMNLQYQRSVADLGAFIAFDGFGLELYYDSDGFNHNCHDSQREEALLSLLELGYADQLLMSQDMGTKLSLRKYGGYGYGHILRDILPSLRDKGVSDETLRRILVDNPRRLLTVSSIE